MCLPHRPSGSCASAGRTWGAFPGSFPRGWTHQNSARVSWAKEDRTQLGAGSRGGRLGVGVASSWAWPQRGRGQRGRGLALVKPALPGPSVSRAPRARSRSQSLAACVPWPGPHAAPRAGHCCCPCCASSSRPPPPSSSRFLSATTRRPMLPSGTGATTVTRTMNFTFATQVSAGEGAGEQRPQAPRCPGRGHLEAQV